MSAAQPRIASSKFLAKRKYRNDLPEIPCDPKCLDLPFDPMRFVTYQTTSLERQFKPQLYSEVDLGVKIDLITRGAYEPHGQLSADDAELLRSETTEEKKRDPYRPSVPWMMKTTYISNEQETRRVENPGFETMHAHNLDVEDEDLDMTLVERIEKSFEAAQKPPVHPVFTRKRAKRVIPLLPDIDLYGNNYVHVAFEENPLNRGTAERVKKIPEDKFAQAILNLVVSGDSKKVELLVPRPGQKKDETADQDYERIREYIYNFTAPSDTYVFLLDLPNDKASYLSLNTKVDMKKAPTRRRGEDYEDKSREVITVVQQEVKQNDLQAMQERIKKHLDIEIKMTSEAVDLGESQMNETQMDDAVGKEDNE